MSARSRRRFDDESPPSFVRTGRRPRLRSEPDDLPAYSTYPEASRGPSPVPEWVITSPDAVDVDLGVLKTGKEADVSLLERRTAERRSVLAVKRYRSSDHRLFHRDAGYLEGRRVRKSRETRAMANRTTLGKELIAGQWAAAEFHYLSMCWTAGLSVPYPVQLLGTELMLEFIGDDGCGAPRLAEVRVDPSEAAALWNQLADMVVRLATLGLAHADLSAYNLLVHHGRVVMIDVPQMVDVVANPQGFEFLRRDCLNVAAWFTQRGVHADGSSLYDAAAAEIGQ